MRAWRGGLLALLLAGAAASSGSAPAWPGLLPEPPSPPPAAPGATPAELLQALVRHSRLPLPLHDGRLGDAGGQRWRELAAASSHVVLGEQHGNAGIAAVARAMWADLAATGWRHAAFEIDPFVAAALRRELQRAGPAGWARFLAGRGGAAAVPFVGWAEELALAAEVPRFWGLDQVFIGSAPWLMQALLVEPEQGLGPAARAAVQGFVAESTQTQDWLGRVEPARLRAAAADTRRGSPARRLLDALHESARMYAPFVSQQGETTTANARREQAMKQRWQQGLQEAQAAAGRPVRVFTKIGAYHAMRGATPTGVQGLGGFVTEWAAARGEAALTVLVLCGPGSLGAVHAGPPQPCELGLGEGGDWQFLRPHLDPAQPTMFDLRTWRLRMRRLQHLPPEVQRIVGSFDLLVFVPAAPAATPIGVP